MERKLNAAERLKRQSPYVEVRKALADEYRRIRKTRPEMARLLFKRAKIAQRAAIDGFLYGTFECHLHKCLTL